MERVTRLGTVLAITVVSAAGGVAAAVAQEVTLRFRPDVGAELAMRQEIRQDGVVELGPLGRQNFASEMTIEATQRILEAASADGRRVEQTVDRVAMVVRQGAQEVLSMDSANEEPASAGGAPVAAMVGHAFVIEMDALGRPVAVEGADSLLEGMESGGEESQKATVFLRQVFNDDSLLQMMQSALPALPEGPVSPGTRWDHQAQIDNPLLGAILVDSRYAFEGLDEVAGEACARVTVELDMEIDIDALLAQLSGRMGGGMKATADVDRVESTGSMCVALADGVTLVSEMAPQMGMTMHLEAEGQQPIKMKMSLKQTVRQTVTRMHP